MAHGRIEPSPAEQLLELRRSRDRYAALADRLHDSADPDLDPAEILAREQNARRIAHAYEKSISNSVMRMSGADQTHRFALPALGTRTWLAIFVAISVLDGGVLLAHFRPQISRLLPALTSVAKLEWRTNPAPVRAAPPRLATPPAAPPPAEQAQIAQLQIAPAPVTPPVISKAPQSATSPATPAPTPAPSQVAPNAAAPSAKPAAPPPQASMTPAPATPTPASSAPASSAPASSVPIPSARPTSGPVLAITPPPAPVTEPQPAAAPAPRPPAATAATPATPPQTQAPAAPVLTRPQPIAATHTLPPYPVESKRRGESGKTQMQVAVSIQGTASECTVVTSSGSARLDAAACNHVETRWRWKPATRDGQPVAATTAVTVVWSLLQAPL